MRIPEPASDSIPVRTGNPAELLGEVCNAEAFAQRFSDPFAARRRRRSGPRPRAGTGGADSRGQQLGAARGRVRRVRALSWSSVLAIWLQQTAAATLAACVLTAPATRADEIEGVNFPVEFQIGDVDWQLHGVGLLRYKVLIKGYVAALYTRGKLARDEILGDVPRRLEIAYFWSIQAEDFAQATLTGIARNVDAASFERLRPQIDQMNALYANVNSGDRYALTYVPGQGTELALNGRPVGRVAGAEFSSALFAIWLGDEPLSEDLRDQLLDER